MIETQADCTRFGVENLDGDWIVHIVPVEDGCHPVINRPSILFIRNISTKRTYYFALDHPDSIPLFPRLRFVEEFLSNNKNRKWAFDKKAFGQMMNLPNVCDANLVGYMKENEILVESDYETPAHFLVRKHLGKVGKTNLAIPLMKHLEVFNDLADDITNLVKKYEPDDGFVRFNDLIIDTLRQLESQGIYVDRELFKQRYNIDPGPYGIVFSQYNPYTATGRPSNRFDNVNYAALNQSDGTRKCFRSRWGKDGRVVVIDYAAFHPRIIAHLTRYPISVKTDIYEYLARLYFHKKDVDEIDVKEAKTITFRQLYGGVEDKYSHIKYLANLKTFIDTQWAFFQKNGYILTPFFKRKITKHHILDPNPSKVFNYLLQGVEGELAIPKIKEVLEYLRDKKTKATLYVYDSILLDFHKNDGYDTLKEIKRIMSFDDRFPMKTYIGETYQDIKQIGL
jgi:hypothetical protein